MQRFLLLTLLSFVMTKLKVAIFFKIGFYSLNNFNFVLITHTQEDYSVHVLALCLHDVNIISTCLVGH